MPSARATKRITKSEAVYKPVIIRGMSHELWLAVKLAAMRDGQTVSAWVSEQLAKAIQEAQK